MEIRVDPYLIMLPQNPVIRLRERDGENRAIDITISPVSLYNLLTIINDQGIDHAGRPIIHKVMINTLLKLGLDIQKVIVDDIIDGKFHSHIYVKNGGQIHSIDTHVPDAIGLSIIQDCPLLILENLFAKAAEHQAKRLIEIYDEEAIRILENFDPDKAPKN